LSAFDAIALAGPREDRVIEFVDHLHEHFVDPVRMRRGHYLLPEKPGYSTEIRAESRASHRFPDGEVWR
jgi:L-fuconate dehydratase